MTLPTSKNLVVLKISFWHSCIQAHINKFLWVHLDSVLSMIILQYPGCLENRVNSLFVIEPLFFHIGNTVADVAGENISSYAQIQIALGRALMFFTYKYFEPSSISRVCSVEI
jgi:hypothetical protein